MKKILFLIVVVILLLTSVYIFTKPKKETNTDNSNSNINHYSNETSNNQENSNSNINNEQNNNNNSNTIENSNNNQTSNNTTTNTSNKTSNKTSNSTSNKTSNTSNKTSNKTSNTTSNSNTTYLNTNNSFSGIFKSGTTEIEIYQISSTKLHYKMYNSKTKRQYIAYADVSGKKATDDAYYINKFTLNTNSITLDTNHSGFSDGTYYKTKNYTITNFYNTYIGDSSYLNTSMNGIFKGTNSDNKTVSIKFFQKNKSTGFINISYEGKTYFTNVTISGNTFKYSDENYSISGSISNNKITINSSSVFNGHLLHYTSGTYSKSSSYSISQIVVDNS